MILAGTVNCNMLGETCWDSGCYSLCVPHLPLLIRIWLVIESAVRLSRHGSKFLLTHTAFFKEVYSTMNASRKSVVENGVMCTVVFAAFGIYHNAKLSWQTQPPNFIQDYEQSIAFDIHLPYTA